MATICPHTQLFGGSQPPPPRNFPPTVPPHRPSRKPPLSPPPPPMRPPANGQLGRYLASRTPPPPMAAPCLGLPHNDSKCDIYVSTRHNDKHDGNAPPPPPRTLHAYMAALRALQLQSRRNITICSDSACVLLRVQGATRGLEARPTHPRLDPAATVAVLVVVVHLPCPMPRDVDTCAPFGFFFS